MLLEMARSSEAEAKAVEAKRTERMEKVMIERIFFDIGKYPVGYIFMQKTKNYDVVKENVLRVCFRNISAFKHIVSLHCRPIAYFNLATRSSGSASVEHHI